MRHVRIQHPDGGGGEFRVDRRGNRLEFALALDRGLARHEPGPGISVLLTLDEGRGLVRALVIEITRWDETGEDLLP